MRDIAARIAYRTLASRSEAEALPQDAYLRWHARCQF